MSNNWVIGVGVCFAVGLFSAVLPALLAPSPEFFNNIDSLVTTTTTETTTTTTETTTSTTQQVLEVIETTTEGGEIIEEDTQIPEDETEDS